MSTTPDLTNYRLVHRALRRAARRLAVAAPRIDVTDRRQVEAFAAYWKGYAGEILCHHTIEDDFFFPALVEQVATGAAALAAIDGDHDHLDHLMEDIGEEVEHFVRHGGTVRLCELLDELADHMDTHLDIEDADLLPLFERHFTAEEYEALDAKAIKALGLGRQAAFTVPFIAEACTPEEAAALFATAPLPFRILYRMTRGRHARMIATAFGPDLPAEADVPTRPRQTVGAR